MVEKKTGGIQLNQTGLSALMGKGLVNNEEMKALQNFSK